MVGCGGNFLVWVWGTREKLFLCRSKSRAERGGGVVNFFVEKFCVDDSRGERMEPCWARGWSNPMTFDGWFEGFPESFKG